MNIVPAVLNKLRSPFKISPHAEVFLAAIRNPDNWEQTEKEFIKFKRSGVRLWVYSGESKFQPWNPDIDDFFSKRDRKVLWRAYREAARQKMIQLMIAGKGGL